MHVLVAIPFYNEFQTCKPGLRQLEACKEHNFEIVPMQNSTGVGFARNCYIRKFPKFDAILFLDSDIGFTLEDVLCLIEHDKDVVSIPYCSHNNPQQTLVASWVKDNPGEIDTFYGLQERDFKEVDATPLGMSLIKRTVFDKIEYPYFRHILVDCEGRREESSEDYGFCLLCREAGIKIYCDFDRKVYHKPRTEKDFNWDLNEGVSMGQVPDNFDSVILEIQSTLQEMGKAYKMVAQKLIQLQEQSKEPSKPTEE